MAAGNKRVPSIMSIRISRSKLDLIQMIFRNLATILLIAAVVQELRIVSQRNPGNGMAGLPGSSPMIFGLRPWAESRRRSGLLRTQASLCRMSLASAGL